MYLIKAKRISWFLVLSILPQFGFAQNRLDSLQHLREVTVTANPYQELIPAQTLSGIKLGQLSSHNVADALRYFAGVQIKDYGGVGGLKTVNVRNMGTHHTSVFYDGIELGNAQNGITDLGKYSLDDMEAISLYIGQKSEVLQAAKEYTSASVIYLRTKKPKFAGEKKSNLTMRYKTMTMNYHDPSFRIERKINDKLSASLSSGYIRTPGRYKFQYKRNNLDGTVAYDTTGVRKNNDIEAIRIETGLYGRIDKGHWDAKLYYYGSERGSPAALVSNKFENAFRQYDKNFFVQSNFTKEITDRYKVHARAKYAFDRMHYFARDTTYFMGETHTEDAQSDNTYYQQEIYLSIANSYKISKIWDMGLSVDYQWNKLNATLKGVRTLFAYPTRNSLYAAISTTVNLGKFKAMGSLSAIGVFDDARNGAVAPDKRSLAPAVFIGYKPFDEYDFNIRTFAKRNFRMPTFNDLYYTQIGSSVLKPEYMNQYDIGFTYGTYLDKLIFRHLSLQVDAYYTKTTDKIIAAPTGTLFRWMMMNLGKVTGKGVDAIAGLEMEVGNLKFHTNLNYTYSSARDFTEYFGGLHKLTSYGDQIPYTPWHSGSVIQNITYNTWSLNYSFIYVGKRYNGNVNNIKVNEIQPWYTHDLSLQKEITINKTKLRGTIEVNDLLDQFYEVVYNYPMPRRTFRFIISVDI
ncbi:MAG: TonB-dependent receptor plug domain-containing protein [Prevotella sp.]|jgi:outer membrane cobalamin receptor|nr:TonB-dependent receptor plug domain-containing protein [Prevotella sp.]